MDLFLNAHKRFLLLLSRHKVKFLLIGGYAVIYYGYERTTNDMDIWLKPSNKNRDRIIRAFREHGVDSEKLNVVKEMDFTKPQVLTIGKKPNQIVFLTVVAGLNFEEADEKKNLLDLEKEQIGFLGYEDLITNKMVADRPQDKADVDMLQKIQRERNDNQ